MAEESGTRWCADCCAMIQGGARGWQGHRFTVHGEGEAPADHRDDGSGPRVGSKPWTPEQHAAARRRRIAARRKTRNQPPPPGGPDDGGGNRAMGGQRA